jgi:hypothetical protein
VRRSDLVALISRRLDGRRLIWFGTRGDDVEAALELPEMAAAFSIISRFRSRDYVTALALEDLTGRRVDLDSYELDDHLHEPEVRELRSAIFTALAGRSAVFTYRPSTFLSAICFARRDRCQYVGLFKDHQNAFEHKPWVETAVADLGLPHIPWTYVADEDQFDTLRMLRDGPVMLRRSRSSGGTGLVRLDDETGLRDAWLSSDEAYVSVAPYVDGGLPVNIGAVAWRDGVTFHPASVQLIGQPSLTRRPFGYCGNDFTAVNQLPASTIASMEHSTRVTGDWLRSQGYVGAFGIDFLVKDGVPLFTEVNPRFQGSTHASCQLSVEMDESCLLLEHMAALLGLPAPDPVPLARLIRDSPPLSHVVLHNTDAEPAAPDITAVLAEAAALPGFCRADVRARPNVPVESGATIARVTLRRPVTTTGFDLDADVADLASRLRESAGPIPVEHA